MAESKLIRLGTRSSPLARWQADWVTDRLRDRGVEVQQVLIKTTGDVRSEPIGQLQVQGVFTKQIQQALLEHEIDLAVHSLKDLPTEPIAGLTLGAVPQRGPVGDVLITNKAQSFAELAPQSCVATGSLRRRAQLLAARSDLQLVDVRGNIDTRLNKLRERQFDALVLAEAALKRLDFSDQIVEVFDKQVMLPAVGQGALGLEIRDDDQATRELVALLNDEMTYAAVSAERALLASLRGGCLAPVGAWARVEADQLVLDGVVLSVDGKQRAHVQRRGNPVAAVEVGQAAAAQLLDDGAGELIDSCRR